MGYMKKVFLTGAAGAIGVHMLAHIMHNTDWDVIATESFKSEDRGHFDRLTQVCKDHPEWKSRIRLFTHDLIAPFSAREIGSIGHIDYIINLASRSDVQYSIESPVSFVHNNNELMVNMLEFARDVWGLRDGNTTPPEGAVFLHFSTDEVYGAAQEGTEGHKEWDTIMPSNPYSASKAAQEAFAIAWWRSFGVPLMLTNTMNNFGEMQGGSKFPAMIQANIKNDRTTKVHSAKSGEIGSRFYIHSRNVADAVLFILKNVPVVLHRSGEVDRPVRFNIVGNQRVNNLELVQIIGRLMGVEPKYELVYFHESNPGHDLHYGLDGAALAALGWKPPIDFEESLKNTIEWQQRHPEWMK